ncbi:MAG: universal stress protein [Halofilum sp. (in: g-proteobacteria)]|nr:universal stress protein [Halofilum sp. (in: g-proteobacteria)]
MIKKILVPVDGSEHSDRAVELGSDLASKYGAPLVLLQVLLSGHVPNDIRKLSDKAGEERPALTMGAAHVEAYLPDEVREDIADKLLERARATAEKHGAKQVETVKDSGNVTERIIAQAREHRADTIVMGSRGLTYLEGILLGSVSHKVLQLFDGTVITVR